MHRIARTALIVSVAVLAACGDAPPEQTGKTAKSLPAEGPKVRRIASALPDHYAAALPSTSQALADWREAGTTFPPPTHVVDGLARGDADLFARLAAASEQVAEHDALAWAQGWHQHLHYRDIAPAFCERARTVVEAPPSRLRLALVGSYAGHCARADAQALIVRADTPHWAVLAWYSPWRDRALGAAMPYDDRLAELLRAAIARDDRSAAYEAAAAMARHPDPAAQAALRAAHASVADAAFSARLAQAMQPVPSSSQPAAVASDATRDLATRLRTLGFGRVDPEHRGDATTADALLVEAGHAYWFDVETGTFPNEHDALLRALADTVHPALDGVVFEEVAPDIDDEEGGYVLRAYVDGQMLETPAENLGDWYDVDAVLRLLDAVLLERRSDQRFVLLATMDQTATVVGGPGEALRAALDAGLIRTGDPKAAEALGKAFEGHVRGMLERGESH